MPKIKLDRTVKFKKKTYKLGEIVEISVEDVEALSPYGEIIKEEQSKKNEVELKKSTRRNTKRACK